MKEITIKVYNLNELNDKAKDKAREWYREHVLDYDWWDNLYEDAKMVGLKITSFDLNRHHYIKGQFEITATKVANKIIINHGPDCETYKTAQNFLKNYNSLPDDSPEQENAVAEFEKSLLKDYLILLEKEMELLISDEQVDELITVNDYTFTEEGKRFG